MQWSRLNLVCLALCCFHTASGKAEESRQYAPYQELHHHERHWGPYFEERNVTQVTAHVGAEALLNCRVVMLKDKTVMWLRHATETAQLLTVGPAPYAGDNRVASKFQYPNNWRLSINPVKWSDAGRYMCQISTHPPRTIYTDLSVLPPVLTINGDSTHDVKDKFYKAGSSIKLTCVISDEYVSTLPTKVPIVITTSTKPTTPQTTTTEMTTRMSTIFNRIDLMLNRSWSVETTRITSTVSISTTTKSESTTEAVQPVTRPILNNIYGLVWRKQGKDLVDFITWRNMRTELRFGRKVQYDEASLKCKSLSAGTIVTRVFFRKNSSNKMLNR
ncbi:unnamed protein product [Leptosia nina]|uniref:Ig-like domain-containing protein n=1 Tax=Leptosia nina TaxID=320188 RepID=A0AAV1J2N0_9NEOP